MLGRVLDAAGGAIPVCVGVSHAATDRAVAFAREAEAAGAHSVMLAPPPLARPTDAAASPPLPRGRRGDRRCRSSSRTTRRARASTMSVGVPAGASRHEAPACRVIKLEEEPTPPKVGRLVAARRTCVSSAGWAARCCSRSCGAAPHGTMTGFGFPEVLVAVVRRWRAGRPGRRRRGSSTGYATADPVREPGAAQPADPQARLPAAGRDRPRDRPRPGRAGLTRARSPTSMHVLGGRASTALAAGSALPGTREPERPERGRIARAGYGSARIMPAVHRHDGAGDERRRGRQQERPDPADLRHVAVAAERDRRLVRRAISSGVTPAASARRRRARRSGRWRCARAPGR